MLAIRRTLILMLAAFGAALAAVQIGSGPPSIRDPLAADETNAPPAGSTEEEQAPAPVTEPAASGTPPSDADVEAELRRAEEALGGKAKASEELPVKPLRADLPISLPSDI